MEKQKTALLTGALASLATTLLRDYSDEEQRVVSLVCMPNYCDVSLKERREGMRLLIHAISDGTSLSEENANIEDPKPTKLSDFNTQIEGSIGTEAVKNSTKDVGCKIEQKQKMTDDNIKNNAVTCSSGEEIDKRRE